MTDDENQTEYWRRSVSSLRAGDSFILCCICCILVPRIEKFAKEEGEEKKGVEEAGWRRLHMKYRHVGGEHGCNYC